MKKLFAAITMFAFALILTVGCQPVAVTTPAKPEKEKNSDIHIRTPGANVDIEGKGKDRKVDVDLHPKDKNP